jgi:hypothetical protein
LVFVSDKLTPFKFVILKGWIYFEFVAEFKAEDKPAFGFSILLILSKPLRLTVVY